jgi:hypothetical protein
MVGWDRLQLRSRRQRLKKQQQGLLVVRPLQSMKPGLLSWRTRLRRQGRRSVKDISIFLEPVSRSGSYRSERNGICDNHLAGRLGWASRAVRDGGRAARDGVNRGRVDRQRRGCSRISRRRVVQLSTVDEVAGLVGFVCGGQSREPGHGEGDELHGEMWVLKMDS